MNTWKMKNFSSEFTNIASRTTFLDHDRVLSLFHDQSDYHLKSELTVTACKQD